MGPLRRIDEHPRLALEVNERLLDRQPPGFNRSGIRARDVDRRADRDADLAARLRHLVAIPALRGPERRRLDVKRQDRLPRRAREPRRARLRDARGPARAIDSECHRALLLELAAQLHERARPAVRGRSARRRRVGLARTRT